jgi:uncharacterized membrane protein
MFHFKRVRIAACGVLALLGLAVFAALYVVTELGAAGAGTFSGPRRINAASDVPGSTHSPAAHATASTRRSTAYPGTLGVSNSQAYGSSNSEQIVGESNLPRELAANAASNHGGATNDSGISGDADSEALDITNYGQLVGQSSTAGNVANRAGLSTNGSIKGPGTPGGTESLAHGINDPGQIARFGAVTGDGAMPGADPGTESLGARVGNPEQIVGYSVDGGASSPTLWVSDSVLDLNTLLDYKGSGLPLTAAWAANDLGQIAGSGINPIRERHAFLSTATIPIPSTVTLISFGLFVFWIIRRGNTARQPYTV